MCSLQKLGLQQIDDAAIPLDLLVMRNGFRAWVYRAKKDAVGLLTAKGESIDIETAQDVIFWWQGFDDVCRVAGLNSNEIRKSCRGKILAGKNIYAKSYMIRMQYHRPRGAKKNGSCR